MNYRKEIQESLDYDFDEYTLKTNAEIIDVICDFGCGMTEFHTADITRLINEHEKMYDLLKDSSRYLHIGSGTGQDKAIMEIGKAIELYGH